MAEEVFCCLLEEERFISRNAAPPSVDYLPDSVIYYPPSKCIIHFKAYLDAEYTVIPAFFDARSAHEYVFL